MYSEEGTKQSLKQKEFTFAFYQMKTLTDGITKINKLHEINKKKNVRLCQNFIYLFKIPLIQTKLITNQSFKNIIPENMMHFKINFMQNCFYEQNLFL